MGDPTTENLIQCPVHGEMTPNGNHIIPRSRDGKNAGNINKETCPICHEYYHWLFSNLKPDEIIAYLVKRFWGGQVEWVYAFLEEYEDKKDDGWPESEANWSPHLSEGRHRQAFEGELRFFRAVRDLGLGLGALCIVKEGTKEIVRSVKRKAGETQQELLEILLDGKELGPDESIRTVV